MKLNAQFGNAVYTNVICIAFMPNIAYWNSDLDVAASWRAHTCTVCVECVHMDMHLDVITCSAHATIDRYSIVIPVLLLPDTMNYTIDSIGQVRILRTTRMHTDDFESLVQHAHVP